MAEMADTAALREENAELRARLEARDAELAALREENAKLKDDLKPEPEVEPKGKSEDVATTCHFRIDTTHYTLLDDEVYHNLYEWLDSNDLIGRLGIQLEEGEVLLGNTDALIRQVKEIVFDQLPYDEIDYEDDKLNAAAKAKRDEFEASHA